MRLLLIPVFFLFSACSLLCDKPQDNTEEAGGVESNAASTVSVADPTQIEGIDVWMSKPAREYTVLKTTYGPVTESDPMKQKIIPSFGQVRAEGIRLAKELGADGIVMKTERRGEHIMGSGSHPYTAHYAEVVRYE